MSKVKLRPSAGFLLLFFSYSLLVATLAWGFSTPELDRVWNLLQDMQRREFAGLGQKDVQVFKAALGHYPTLPRAVIGRAPIGFLEPTRDGWISTPRAHLLASAQPQSTIAVLAECQASSGAYPITVTLEAESGRRELRFNESGRQSFDFHLSSQGKSEVIPVTIVAAGTNHQNPDARIRFSVKGPPESKGSP